MKKLTNHVLTLVVTLGLFSAVAVQSAGRAGVAVSAQQMKNTKSQVNEALKLQRETAKLAEMKQNEVNDEAVERQTEVVEKEKSRAQKLLARAKEMSLTQQILAGAIAAAGLVIAADVAYYGYQGSYTGTGLNAAGSAIQSGYTTYAPESVQKAGSWVGTQAGSARGYVSGSRINPRNWSNPFGSAAVAPSTEIAPVIAP